ncbi:MAG TPA: LacI family DNA-binding transcriptional regulator [Chloroflexia bacterium]|nr:LacI family DNA-binding transcriptional regulator [Chloroflexia bacterium]
MTQPTKRTVTVTQVASKAAVSLATASRVLNNHPKVEPNLRQRVLKAAEELGYVRRPSPPNWELVEPVKDLSATSERKLTHVAFCCRVGTSPQSPSDVNSYFSLVLQGAEAECRRRNLQLSYWIIEDSPDELIRIKELLNESQAGALLLINFTNRQLVQGLIEAGKPAVLIDQFFPDLPLDVVVNDSYQGSLEAMEYLVNKGHRRIAFVSGRNHYTVQRRYQAYRFALLEANIEFQPEWLIAGDLSVGGGEKAAEEFLRRKLDCTAVFCVNDSTALGFIKVMAQNGLRVPQDLSVIGFDDIPAADYIWPPLTTVRTNAPKLGQIAIHRLVERINYPELPFTQTLVGTQLIERASVQTLIDPLA